MSPVIFSGDCISGICDRSIESCQQKKINWRRIRKISRIKHVNNCSSPFSVQSEEGLLTLNIKFIIKKYFFHIGVPFCQF